MQCLECNIFKTDAVVWKCSEEFYNYPWIKIYQRWEKKSSKNPNSLWVVRPSAHWNKYVVSSLPSELQAGGLHRPEQSLHSLKAPRRRWRMSDEPILPQATWSSTETTHTHTQVFFFRWTARSERLSGFLWSHVKFTFSVFSSQSVKFLEIIKLFSFPPFACSTFLMVCVESLSTG